MAKGLRSSTTRVLERFSQLARKWALNFSGHDSRHLAELTLWNVIAKSELIPNDLQRGLYDQV